jgi:arsenate reductase
VLSAGLAPADRASDVTILSLAEIGIDDSDHVPSPVSEDLVATSTVVIAMKPGLALPQIDSVTYETWDLPDPATWDVAAIRPLRDHIDALVTELLGRVLGR